MDNPFVILLLIILFFGAIALVVFLLRKFIPGVKEKGGKIDEATAVQEELDRVLEPIDDKEIKEKMDEYDENEDKKD